MISLHVEGDDDKKSIKDINKWTYLNYIDIDNLNTLRSDY